jgi:ArsR family transcriptional regulator
MMEHRDANGLISRGCSLRLPKACSVRSQDRSTRDLAVAIPHRPLSAFAQTTRLDTFRLLVSREPDGVAAGELARLVAVPQNTMSTHLAILARAGLVRGERQSRSIMYRADLQRFRELTLFLLKDCCGGRPDICAPLVADLTPCHPAKASAND